MKFQIPEKVKRTINMILTILFVAVIVSISFLLGYRYSIAEAKSLRSPNPFTTVHTASVTSVSVTERGELMVIDRNTGIINVYENTVGVNIFKSYANKIYQENNNK